MGLSELTAEVQVEQHDTPSDWALLRLGLTIGMDREEEKAEEGKEKMIGCLDILNIAIFQMINKFLDGCLLVIGDKDRQDSVCLWRTIMPENKSSKSDC